MLSVDELKSLLKLRPLHVEGGYFMETYRSSEIIPSSALPSRYLHGKALSTAIYFLLTPDTCSRLHRLPTDEIYHFYLGDPVEMLELGPGAAHSVTLLGQDLQNGMRPQHVVAGGVWQGSRLVTGGRFALLGTTMAPGYDVSDFEEGNRETLLRAYPACRELIATLTKESG